MEYSGERRNERAIDILLFSPILFLIITKILTSPRPIMGLSSDQFLSDLNLIHLETELGSSGI
jgi:hypothetical protein